MAFTFDQVDITGLRAVHFEQLQSYLDSREEEGWYYGNKKQFDQRHEELKEWLKGIVITARDPDARIPKKIGGGLNKMSELKLVVNNTKSKEKKDRILSHDELIDKVKSTGSNHIDRELVVIENLRNKGLI